MLRKRWADDGRADERGERKQRIIADIIRDFGVKPRLNNDRARPSWWRQIYDACHYYRLFRTKASARIAASSRPTSRTITRSREPTKRRRALQVRHLHAASTCWPRTRPPQYEGDEAPLRGAGQPEAADRGEQAADRFRRAELHYIYLDNELRDHNLFQAICRTNRLDGDDKGLRSHRSTTRSCSANVQEASPSTPPTSWTSMTAVMATNNVQRQRTGWKRQEGWTQPAGADLPVRRAAADIEQLISTTSAATPPTPRR